MSDFIESDRSTTFPSIRVDASAAAIVIGFGAAVALRIATIFRYRIDSDETQHLHVAWGWANGLLQYRDLFDNHMPLFHILCAPLLRIAGERPETLLLARLTMLPLFAAIVLLTYRIAISCHPQRAALWATLIGSLAPDFFLCSVEFRTDVLWTACWLASIAILVCSPLTSARAAAAGLSLGIAAAVSAKTVLLAASLGLAAVITLVVSRDRPVRIHEIAKRAMSFSAALLLPPSLVGVYFAFREAWKPFLYGTVTHNLVASEHPHRLFLLPALLLIIILGTQRIMRDDIPSDVRRRRVFLFLTAAIYGAAMVSLWPIIQTEHWLPFYPVAAVATVPLLLPKESGPQPRLAMAILALELLWIVRLSTPWRNDVVPSMALIEQTMKLTTRSESVIDLKGEMVFRRRAYYYVLEKITKKKIANKELPDTIAADIIRTRTMVAVPDDSSFPRSGRAFLLRNFVRVGCLRVAGMIVPRSRTFPIEIPGDYAVVSDHGDFRGTLDGTAYVGGRFLGQGTHTLVSSAPSNRNAVIWQRAAELRFSPFIKDGRCADDGVSGAGTWPARYQ
ncbi:MAG TPA: hypothetical protein VGS96_12590 [Thermoanaerobaculia bacterium]|nr:hypothetical protein [Thermoanaerobaculia bacterium]